MEESFEQLGSEIDLKQIFEIIKSARDNSKIWLTIKSPFTANKSLAVAVAALAQTKVCYLFIFFHFIRTTGSTEEHWCIGCLTS